jgi:ELWxxDGT repeat protein
MSVPVRSDLSLSSLFSGHLANVNGALFFAWGSSGDYEPWKTDGTYEGTVLVKDVNPNGP